LIKYENKSLTFWKIRNQEEDSNDFNKFEANSAHPLLINYAHSINLYSKRLDLWITGDPTHILHRTLDSSKLMYHLITFISISCSLALLYFQSINNIWRYLPFAEFFLILEFELIMFKFSFFSNLFPVPNLLPENIFRFEFYWDMFFWLKLFFYVIGYIFEFVWIIKFLLFAKLIFI